VSAVGHVLRELTTFVDSGPPPWFLLLLIFVTYPVVSLVHELGHAGAALALLPGRVAITVGGHQPLVACDLGRMALAIHPVALPWRFHATCAYEAPASRVESALIALAGPAASLLTAIGLSNALARAGAGLLHDVLWTLTFCSLGAAIVNLVPFTFTNRPSDGALIVAALR
jgi:hypothetical protein